MANAFNDMINAMQNELQSSYGVRKTSIVPGGKHPRLSFKYGGRDREIPLPHNPQPRTVKNMIAQMRNSLGPRIDNPPKVGVSVYDRDTMSPKQIRIAFDSQALIELYGHDIPEEPRVTVVPMDRPLGFRIKKERGDRGYQISPNWSGQRKKSFFDDGFVGSIRMPADRFAFRSTVLSELLTIECEKKGVDLVVLLPEDWAPVEPVIDPLARELEQRVADEPEPDDLLTPREATHLAGRTSTGWIYDAVKRFGFPVPCRTGPNRWSRRDVEEWVEKNPPSSQTVRNRLIREGVWKDAPAAPKPAPSDSVDELRAAKDLLNELLAANPDVEASIKNGLVILRKTVVVDI